LRGAVSGRNSTALACEFEEGQRSDARPGAICTIGPAAIRFGSGQDTGLARLFRPTCSEDMELSKASA